MSNYIYLNEPFNELEWYWFDIKRVVSSFDVSVYHNLTVDQLREYMFIRSVNVTGAYNRFDKESYPVKLLTNPVYNIVPDFQNRNTLSFEEVTILRAKDLLTSSSKYNRTYVFYSGGIDSTLILAAIIKYWPTVELARLTIVLNQHSIDENVVFYETYIKGRLHTASTDDFFSSAILDNQSLYVTGDLGDPLMSHDDIVNFDKMFSGILNKPYRKNTDSIIKYFSLNSSTKDAILTYSEICKTLASLKYEIETVHDFLWFINFVWGWDIDIYQPMWYWKMSPETNSKLFLEENFFVWFNTKEYQEWSINTIGTDAKLAGEVTTVKYAMKKFIHNFNSDSEYFKHKVHEGSISKNRLPFLNITLCGVDSDYNFHYRNVLDHHRI